MVKEVYYIVGLLIMVMDVVAGILGIQAEVAQNKVLVKFMHLYIHSLVWKHCRRYGKPHAIVVVQT